MTDSQLLQTFLRDKDQAAFAKLVQRHVDWVYSTACRAVNDPHIAEDVTQAVFILVAQKAAPLARHPHLTGWLFRTTRYCAANALEQRRHRRLHEREARIMRPETAPDQPAWADIAPQLDAAVSGLAAGDRDAVLLKYYKGQSLAQVGQTLGISEEAAKKRLQRAMEKLRLRLTLTAQAANGTALAAVIAAHATQAAPVKLAALATAAALAPASATAHSLLIAKGVAYMISTAKAVKISALVAILILSFVGGIVLFRPATPTPKPGTGRPSPAVNQVEPQVRFTVKNADGQTPANITALLFHYNPTTYQQETVMEFHGMGLLAAEFPSRYFHRKGGSWMIAFANNGGLAYYRLPDIEPADPIALTLSRPARLKGKVLDRDGQPISGALVWVFSVWPHGDKPPADAQPVTLQNGGIVLTMPPQAEMWSGLLQQPHPSLSATSASDGTFDVPHLVEGATVEVFCHAPGYAQIRQKLDLSDPNPTITLKDPEAIIKGRVIDAAGAPIKNLFVAAQGTRGGVWQTAPTADDGIFTLRYLSAGEYNIFPGLDPNEATSISVASLVASAGQTVNAPDIRVLPGTLIDGLVVDAATGLPVQPGASSDIGFYGPARPRSGGSVQSADIGPDGTFHIRLPPGENFPYLRSQDWIESPSPGTLVIAPNQDSLSLTVRVQRAPPGRNNVLIIR